jgi:hypothetical protein
MRAVTRHWKMADGRVTRICDMSDSHLANAIACRERIAEDRRYRPIVDPNSPFASVFAAIAEKWGLFDEEHEAYSDPLDGDALYDALVYEQTRRELYGITVPVNDALAVAAFEGVPFD